MATRVYAHSANPAKDQPLYKLSVAQAAEMVSKDKGFPITLPDGRRAIQLYSPTEVQLERAARNTVLKRGAIGKIKHPPRLHYSIPARGDHRLRWKQRFLDMANEMLKGKDCHQP